MSNKKPKYYHKRETDVFLLFSKCLFVTIIFNFCFEFVTDLNINRFSTQSKYSSNRATNILSKNFWMLRHMHYTYSIGG